MIAEETQDKILKRVLLDMVVELREGDTFARAASHPEAFPRYYVAVLESAELTGTLDKVLLEFADYMETGDRGPFPITSALIYPAVVAVLAVVTVIILATFVIPKFRTFFDSLNAKLPLPTRMFLSVSGFVGKWWWAIARVMLLIVVTFIACAARRRVGPARRGPPQDARRRRPAAGLHRRAGVPGPRFAGHRRGRPPRAMAVTAESSNNAVYRDGHQPNPRADARRQRSG